MKYESNYYCNGFGFEEYEEAKRYADFMLEWKRMYKAVFTKAEMNAMKEEDVMSYFDFKNIERIDAKS